MRLHPSQLHSDAHMPVANRCALRSYVCIFLCRVHKTQNRNSASPHRSVSASAAADADCCLTTTSIQQEFHVMRVLPKLPAQTMYFGTLAVPCNDAMRSPCDRCASIQVINKPNGKTNTRSDALASASSSDSSCTRLPVSTGEMEPGGVIPLTSGGEAIKNQRLRERTKFM